MTISNLNVIITIAGIIFFAVALVIVILGKKVGEGNSPQMIKLKNIELKTNSVITLLIITAAFALGPLALSYMYPDVENYVSREKLHKDYIPLDGLVLTIRGNVIGESNAVNNVNVKVKRTIGSNITELTDSTDQMGFFAIDLDNVKPKERYELLLKKDGYQDIRYKFGFLEINANHRLKKVAQ